MKKLIFFIIPFSVLQACNGVADNANTATSAPDTLNAAVQETASSPNPAPAAAAADSPAVARVANSAEEERVRILTNIDTYLVPKAVYTSDHDGIRGATVTLENTLEDVLFQKAFVEVKFLSAEGLELRTDFLTYQNIEPGDIKTLKVNDMLRASVMQVKVVKLKSEKLTRGEMILVGERFKNL
ncbi:MAG: hypothetical protein IPP93_03635 [Chitinophagaceae bacterium]|nr:hypothetical protein [Chitinophagaceae bacterium]MBL0334398.1 hypothetical protein [Chitinophagaceae bacterium]